MYKAPTVQQPGTYSLKATAFAAEFDPFFWFRNGKKAEVRGNLRTAIAAPRERQSGFTASALGLQPDHLAQTVDLNVIVPFGICGEQLLHVGMSEWHSFGGRRARAAVILD